MVDIDDMLRVDNRSININHKNKVLFPDNGTTKGDLVDYYRRISDIMVPYMKGRPVTMHRFPRGIQDQGFYQQEISDYFPRWIRRITLEKEEGEITHLICNDASTLVYMANQACITPHVWLSRDDLINYPDTLLFDLDPPDGNFIIVCRVAFYLQELLNELKLKSFVKTTGSRGLHIIIPLDRGEVFDQVRKFAQNVARLLVNQHPEEITDEQRKHKRGNRVFIDTSRNSYGQTAVTPYALRAKPGAPIATPIDWDELTDKKINAQSYNIKNIFLRLSKRKDPWRGIWRNAYSLREAIDIIDNFN